MNLDTPTLQALTTVAGATLLTVPLTEVVKRALKMSADAVDRFMPVIAIVIGVLVVSVASFGLGLTGRADLVNDVVAGVFAGLAACGLYDAGRGLTS